jgi:hypothetical protein
MFRSTGGLFAQCLETKRNVLEIIFNTFKWPACNHMHNDVFSVAPRSCRPSPSCLRVESSAAMSTGASQRSVRPTHSSLPARDSTRYLAVAEHGVFQMTFSRRTFRISVGTQRRPANAVDADAAPRPALHEDDEDDMDGMADRFDDNCRCDLQCASAQRARQTHVF